MAQENQGRMLAVERRQRIIEMLENHSSVLIADICRECGVSAVTARADLDFLEGEGRLKRTHGGAVPISEYVVPRVSERVRKNARAKQAIARRAAERVSDGEMILVGSGSTTLEFVKALRSKHGVTVVSNSCHILEYAEQYLPEVEVVSTGGMLARKYRHYYGPLVGASLADIYLDQVFLGADGFEPSFGFLAEFDQTAYAKVEFLKHARTKIILMDSSKVGAGRSFLRFAKPDDVDVVIMERDPEGMVLEACNQGERDVQVIEALADEA